MRLLGMKLTLLSAIMLAGLASPSWSQSDDSDSAKTPDAKTADTKTAPPEVKVTEVKQTSKTAPVALNANQIEANKLIAKAYGELRLQNWGFAVASLCSALKYDRNNVVARRYLCYALLQAGNARDAISQLDALSMLNQGIPFDMCMRGEALGAMGELDKSIEALKNALSTDPNNDYIRGKVIETLQNSGKYQDAAAIASEGYFNAKTSPARSHYLTLFNTVQQQRAVLAQRTLGMQIATTSAYPMMPPKPTVPAVTKSTTAVTPDKDKDKAKDKAAESDDE